MRGTVPKTKLQFAEREMLLAKARMDNARVSNDSVMYAFRRGKTTEARVLEFSNRFEIAEANYKAAFEAFEKEKAA